jgi:hypothetical protein
MDFLSYSFNEGETAGEMPAVDSSIIMNINRALEDCLSDNVLTPQSGFQRIRKTLFRYRLDMPAVFELNSDDDEMVLHVHDLEMKSSTNLYVIYSRNDDGYFEFYAEVGDSERMQKLLSDEEEIEDN